MFFIKRRKGFELEVVRSIAFTSFGRKVLYGFFQTIESQLEHRENLPDYFRCPAVIPLMERHGV
jgi:hypothetical protein